MSKITKSAQGEECTLRLFPHCNDNPETTVYCHIYCEDKGMSKKSPDFWGVYGCSTCHGIIDGHIKADDVSAEDIYQSILRGLYLTHKKLIEKGLMIV